MSTRGWEGVTARAVLDRKPMAKAKYRNVKVTADGEVFDSKHELQVYRDLQARQAAGEIRDLKHHPGKLALKCPQTALGECAIVAWYEPDFSYLEKPFTSWDVTIADAKSPATRKNAIYVLKKKWLRLQEGIEVLEL